MTSFMDHTYTFLSQKLQGFCLFCGRGIAKLVFPQLQLHINQDHWYHWIGLGLLINVSGSKDFHEGEAYALSAGIPMIFLVCNAFVTFKCDINLCQ